MLIVRESYNGGASVNNLGLFWLKTMELTALHISTCQQP